MSATFAASLVISPSLGTLIIDYTENGERNVVILATVVSVLNLLFIVFCVPESLPESVRKASWGSSISCEQADPFAVSACVRCLFLFVFMFVHFVYVLLICIRTL